MHIGLHAEANTHNKVERIFLCDAQVFQKLQICLYTNNVLITLNNPQASL